MQSVLKRPTEVMHGTLIGADFPADTITLEMEPGYYTAKMRFAVVPADEYTRQCEQRAELLEALQAMTDAYDNEASADNPENRTARAAIANATQQRNATGSEG